MDDKKVNMLAKQLRKDYPEAWEVFASTHDNQESIWIRKGNEIIECPYFSPVKILQNEFLKFDKFWYATVGMFHGEASMLIEIHSCKDYTWHMEHMPGITYFPERYFIRDYGKTWWGHNPAKESED